MLLSPLRYGCPTSSLPTTNPALVVLKLDLCLRGRQSGTNHLSHDKASVLTTGDGHTSSYFMLYAEYMLVLKSHFQCCP
jgi:hypothetical protein